ncbi:putative membrane protein [Anoxybacillus sp. B7M1]|uniref:Acid-resistance membrane protein n=1 Tax=Anoxybacteroides rupiense TaxID=311460 RepID=A0ABD5IZE9_9BACL|nr:MULTISPECIES: hypothetical protein [Anoxybacillus]ANB56969.1 putative membrane protein [Anoxybacillus sp. B2M1]ANB62449.1 putative membrane protein [Anoxybacillus sp. B7M1]MBS2770420.1 hypothetical protein [Anoxybacillus rupiensis]MED5053603.1 hypothetical protein [Anoxybacillus rupiensis]
MSRDSQQNTSLDSIASGIGFSFSLIVIAIFIYFSPDYLGSEVISLIMSSLMMAFGIIGLGIELNKLNNEKKFGFDDLGIGLGLIIFWAILHYFFPIIWLNWVLLFVLFIGFYGIGVGIVKLVQNIIESSSGRQLAIKISVGIVQIAATAATIYEILKTFNLLP